MRLYIVKVTALWGPVKPSWCVLPLLFSLSSAVLAQTQQPSAGTNVQRDPQAVSVLQQAIVAMGTPKAVAQVQSVIVQGSSVPVSGSVDPSGTVTMEDSFSSQGHEFRDALQSGAATQIFASGHGIPGMNSHGRTKNFPPQMANARLPVHLPAIVLAQFLANTDCNLSFVGQATVNGQTAVQIHLHIDTDIAQQTLSVQDWYFDPSTGLPLRVEYRLPDSTNPLFFVNAAADLSDYRPVQGVLFPFRILSYADSRPRDLLTLSSVVVNPPVSAADFDLPTAVSQ